MTHSAQPASVRAAADTNIATADRPTIYSIGNSADDSLMRQVFPRWAGHLQLGEAELRCIECDVHIPPDVSRKILRSLQADPLSLGALLTSPKPNLLPSCRDMFASLDPDVAIGGQVSSISKRDGKLVGHARESLTSFLALGAFLPSGHWLETKAEMLVLGAGYSAMAFTIAAMDARNERNRPSRIVVSDREKSQLQAIHKVHKKSCAGVPMEYHCITNAADNDALLNALSPGSLVINATGMGKDLPGSPITDKAVFPQDGYAWDFNFQGSLPFLDQARSQRQSRNLQVEDGFVFYVHRWIRAVADAFAMEIPGTGPVFTELLSIARDAR